MVVRDKIVSGAEGGALEVGVANLLLRQVRSVVVATGCETHAPPEPAVGHFQSFGTFRTPVSEIILRQGKGVAPHALVPGECANTSCVSLCGPCWLQAS